MIQLASVALSGHVLASTGITLLSFLIFIHLKKASTDTTLPHTHEVPKQNYWLAGSAIKSSRECFIH